MIEGFLAVVGGTILVFLVAYIIIGIAVLWRWK